MFALNSCALMFKFLCLMYMWNIPESLTRTKISYDSAVNVLQHFVLDTASDFCDILSRKGE